MITFRESDHTYWDNGKRILSVTQILKESGLIIAENYYTEESRVRGIYAHVACHYLDENDLDFSTIDNTLLPYVSAYEKFLKDLTPRWSMIEQIIHNKVYNYAGTLDRFGLINGKKCIVDIKTGNLPYWCGIQLAGYALALEEKNILRYGLQLKQDGEYKLVEYNNIQDQKIFIACCSIANYKLNNGVIK